MPSAPDGAKSIVVIIAMEAEAAPFIERIGAVPVPMSMSPPLPVRAFAADLQRGRVIVVVNGRHPRHGVDLIGTDGAVLATMSAITSFTPDLVVTAGTAGGRRESAQRIGDVVVASGHFVHHDRRIPLPGFRELGIGRFPAAPVDDVASSLGLATGVFSTGNSFGETAEDLEALDESGAIAIDMESAAVAAVCELFDVPVTGVRVIANLIDGGPAAAAGFEEELPDAAASLAEVLRELVTRIATPDAPALDRTDPGGSQWTMS